MTGDQLLQADGLESAVGLDDGPALHLAQRCDRGCVLDGFESISAEGRIAGGNEDRPVPIAADLDVANDDAGIFDGIAGGTSGSGGSIKRAGGCLPLNDILGVDDRDRPFDQIGQRFRDLTQAAARQDDGGEAVMDRGRPLEASGLGVQDDPEDRIDDLVERRFGGQLDDREVEPVGRFDHRRRDGLDIAGRLQGEPRKAAGGEAGYERLERQRVIAERISRGQEQLVGPDPGEDVRNLHDVHGANRTAHSAQPGHDPGSGQGRHPDHLREFHGVDERTVHSTQDDGRVNVRIEQ